MREKSRGTCRVAKGDAGLVCFWERGVGGTCTRIKGNSMSRMGDSDEADLIPGSNADMWSGGRK